MDAVVASLSAGPHCGVLVSGPFATGRTTVVSQAADRLGRSARTVRVQGGCFPRNVAYGDLAGLLTELNPSDVRVRARVFEALTERLSDLAGALDPIVFIDNGDELDELSASMLAEVAASRAARLAITCERPAVLPPGLAELWEDGWLVHVPLRPLTTPESRLLAEHVLGARISAATARRLHSMSGGVPRYLEALVRDQRAGGTLVEVDGVLRLVREEVIGPHSIELAHKRLRRLPQDQREVLELLSLSQTLPLDLVRRFIGETAVDDLTALGLLHVEHGTVTTVSIGEPFIAKTIGVSLPSARACHHRTRLLESTVPDGVLSHRTGRP
ncbi:hypothetical protein GCM10022261_18410 [Brevibacterium daeguense]|uniref:Orc1-like AAA ATPase domain-containing protein n=1 Tax=Brevibacterium daeguense TaxID=909936 RepID=A0ABP8EKA2_9MICO